MNFFKIPPIQGVLLIKPHIHRDKRGFFLEDYRKDLFYHNGIKEEFIQTNISSSKYGTIRGLHFQAPPHSQAKLVKVLQGKILDVAVDLRKGSKTFGRHIAVELSSQDFNQLFIPKEFAHGFSVLSEEALIEYQCSNYYSPKSERCIAHDDKFIDIDWKIPKDKVCLSDKDSNGESFAQYSKNPCY